MDFKLVDRVVNAVLYEGYLLYPYRPSAVKNQQRWNFGVLYPESYSAAQNGTDACLMQTEFLVLAGAEARLDITVRFLHLLAREVGKAVAGGSQVAEYRKENFQVVEALEVNGQVVQTWQEAVERDVSLTGLFLDELLEQPRRLPFTFAATREIELLRDAGGSVAGAVVRKHQSIEGAVEVWAVECEVTTDQAAPDLPSPTGRSRLCQVMVRILNLTPLEEAAPKSRDEALRRSLVSAHTILGVQGGEFVSLLDPPETLREAAADCQNIGTWPVLIGEAGERDGMLSSPIILYDYPQVAPESIGDFFDGTEIDEMLALRVLTLTDEEKREMRNVDERARQILERTETLPAEQMMKLHGAVRGLKKARGGSS